MNIVVVGGSKGLGLELVRHLVLCHHQVHTISRTTGCDARSRRQLLEVRAKLAETWTHVDAVICCAARHGPIEKGLLASHDWIQSVADNLAATLLPLQVFGRMLRLSNDPKVICFSGGGATKGRPMFSAYACAKTATVRLVETIADEEPWLDINAVAPGAIGTTLTAEIEAAQGVSDDERKQARDAKIHRADRLKKLIALLDWLLSPASNGVSGRLIAAQHDNWPNLAAHPDAGKLRRVEPTP